MIKLLRTEIEGINIISDKKLVFDFIAEKKVFDKSIMDHSVNHLFSSIYSLNTIGITGVNASGKTTSLKILEFILNIYLYGTSINEVDSTNWWMNLFNDKLKLSSYFYDYNKNNVSKIVSIIIKDSQNPISPLLFEDEIIYSKDVTNRTTKSSLFDFSDSEIYTVRSKADGTEFLKPDDSIFHNYISKGQKKVDYRYVSSLLSQTNINILSEGFFEQIPLSLVHYLDSSIEKLEFIREEEINQLIFIPEYVSLKFINKPEIKVKHSMLDQYLSSGTMKGINIIMTARDVLNHGGYLIIDEIENHLNKSIVIQIINLFMSPLNKKGATLIFSTHYSEIVDVLSRTDSIYLLLKNEGIKLDKMSNILDDNREDVKKSEILLSGQIPTMPNYKKYKKLYFELMDFLNDGDDID